MKNGTVAPGGQFEDSGYSTEVIYSECKGWFYDYEDTAGRDSRDLNHEYNVYGWNIFHILVGKSRTYSDQTWPNSDCGKKTTTVLMSL